MRNHVRPALRLLTAAALLFAAVKGMFVGAFTIGALVAGLFAAAAIHWWYLRHPSRLPDARTGRMPEINISAIPVGGDIGGLMFAIGAVVIVILGVPDLAAWYFAALACAVFSAWMRVLWRTSHNHRPVHAMIGRF